MSEPRKARVWALVVLGAAMVLAVNVLLTRIFMGSVWHHLPAHSAVEAAGAATGLMLALVLLLLRGFGTPGSGRYLCPVVGLLAMALLDLGHAVVNEGRAFVWLHSTATAVGGFLFALVWLPESVRSRLLFRRVAWALLALALVFAIGWPLSPVPLPRMIEGMGPDFAPVPLALNLLGGSLFLAASVRFGIHFHRTGRTEDVLFTSYCLLFGGAGLLFFHSTLWDPSWWWWHGVRLAGYVFMLVQMVLIFTRIFVEVREALRVRDEFLSIASHELRTPLTPLKLQLQLLSREFSRAEKAGTLPGSHPARRSMEILERQVSRMAVLVEELLDVSRFRTGRVALQRESLDLVELASEVVGRYRLLAAHSDSRIELSAAEPVRGNFDRLRLEQVLSNLITNALKYAPGSVVNVSVRPLDGRAEVEVRDSGPGIRPQDLGRIFEPFVRAHAGEGVGGLGLGLYIVREIVSAHGGTIGVVSRPGQGTNFRIELPLGTRPTGAPE